MFRRITLTAGLTLAFVLQGVHPAGAAGTLTMRDGRAAVRAYAMGATADGGRIVVGHCRRRSPVAVQCEVSLRHVAGPDGGAIPFNTHDTEVARLRGGHVYVSSELFVPERVR